MLRNRLVHGINEATMQTQLLDKSNLTFKFAIQLIISDGNREEQFQLTNKTMDESRSGRNYQHSQAPTKDYHLLLLWRTTLGVCLQAFKNKMQCMPKDGTPCEHMQVQEAARPIQQFQTAKRPSQVPLPLTIQKKRLGAMNP